MNFLYPKIAKKEIEKIESIENEDNATFFDEMPFWSSLFGHTLLDNLDYKKNINILDIGCGTGFPLLEVAQRYGNSCKVYGVDPWLNAIIRLKEKAAFYNVQNVKLFDCKAEDLPFENGFFDLIISNNGINNVESLPKVLSEVNRVSKNGCQFVFTYNLPTTMNEFYEIFEESLLAYSYYDEILSMREHIFTKRRSLQHTTDLLKSCYFEVDKVVENSFTWKFQDAESFFNYHFIKFHFLPSWKNIVKDYQWDVIFKYICHRINAIAKQEGCFEVSIPYVCVKSIKKII